MGWFLCIPNKLKRDFQNWNCLYKQIAFILKSGIRTKEIQWGTPTWEARRQNGVGKQNNSGTEKIIWKIACGTK